MIALRRFQASYDAVLAIWSSFAQEGRRRDLVDAQGRATDAFVFLHGLIFQSEAPADFHVTLTSFLKRLETQHVEEEEWAMMAAVNISSVLDYGRTGDASLDGICWPFGTSGQHKDRPILGETRRQCSFSCSMQLTCAMLALVIRNQLSGIRPCSNLNPYIILTLTFLSAMANLPNTITTIHSHIPWSELRLLVSASPDDLPSFQSPQAPQSASLAEDSYLRGMQWAESLPASLLPEGWGRRRVELAIATGSADSQRWIRIRTAMTRLDPRPVAEPDTVSVAGSTSSSSVKAWRKGCSVFRLKPHLTIRRNEGSMHKI